MTSAPATSLLVVRTAIAGLTTLAALSGCQGGPVESTSSSVERGRALARDYGCGSCHVIPGVRNASSHVGPPLAGMGLRVYAGGQLNTPANLRRFLEDPQSVDPNSPMPNLGVTAEDARALAAYLHELR
jgi:cytochrome c